MSKSDILTPERLAELQALELPRLDWVDIGYEPTEALTSTDEHVLQGYFAMFAKPSKDLECFCCGKALSGFLGSFTWGIANGEGHCGNCGYPARALHRGVGPIRFLETILQWHPSELEPTEPQS